MGKNFDNVFEDLKRSNWIRVLGSLHEKSTACDLSIDLARLPLPARKQFMIQLEDSGLGQAWRQKDSLFLRVKGRFPEELQALLKEIAEVVKKAETDSGQVA